MNRLYARIHNLGDEDIPEDLTVIWRIAFPQVAGGDIETELGRFTVPGGVRPHSFIITPPFEWTPTDSNEGHICVKVEVLPVLGELNATANNFAQENIKHWYSEGDSPFQPVTFEITIKNPFGYFIASGKIEKDGFIDDFAAHIFAQTPVGDTWVTFGGTTAVVHPVNATSIIVLNPPRTTADETVVITGTISTTGPLRPPLAGRQIHLRFVGSDAAREEWITVTTDAEGTFTASMPSDLTREVARIRAFHGGGKGFKPARSNEVVRRE